MEWPASALDWLELVIKFGAVVAVLTGGYTVVHQRIRTYLERRRKFDAALASLEQLPTLTAAVNRLTAMDQMLARVYREVLPNHGTSLRDAVDGVRRELHVFTTETRILQDADNHRAYFVTDPVGAYLHVSRSLQRWTGRSRDELLGWGWINAVAASDRDRVRDEWDRATAEQRDFSLDYSLQTVDGACLQVHVDVTPIRAADGLIERWVGAARRIDRGVVS